MHENNVNDNNDNFFIEITPKAISIRRYYLKNNQ